jgi:isopentenyl-diphosphate delta-isomerase
MKQPVQVFNEQGLPDPGVGTVRHLEEGTLHGSAHVWIWRVDPSGDIEVLLQKRANNKKTFPGLLDISAAGHIDLHESPVDAAIRESSEEIGLRIQSSDLKLIFVERVTMVVPNTENLIENEFCWVFMLQLKDTIDFTLEQKEVESLTWKPFAEFKKEVFGEESSLYVPHAKEYYSDLLKHLENIQSIKL